MVTVRPATTALSSPPPPRLASASALPFLPPLKTVLLSFPLSSSALSGLCRPHLSAGLNSLPLNSSVSPLLSPLPFSGFLPESTLTSYLGSSPFLITPESLTTSCLFSILCLSCYHYCKTLTERLLYAENKTERSPCPHGGCIPACRDGGGGEAINVGSMLAGEECFGEKNREERWGVMLHLE